MKIKFSNPLLAPKLNVLATILFTGFHAQANITGMNTPSGAGIRFDDSNSINGSAGGIYPTATGSGWIGTPLPLTQLDSTTGDFANGIIDASWTPLSYSIGIPTATLTQNVLSTGVAVLDFQAIAEFQTDSTGFLGGAMLFPTFFVDGTVQPGGFALFNGTIDYYINGIIPPVGSVSYAFQAGNLGAFPISFSAVPVGGFPNVSSIPAVPANGTLTLVASFKFTVDPASINVTTVPEPGSGLLLGFGALGGLLWRRSARAAALS